MQVSQMINNNGNPAANQFILNDKGTTSFQSYNTIIAKYSKTRKLTLDKNALNYSRTTNKHLYMFTGENRKELLKGIASGVILTANLNK